MPCRPELRVFVVANFPEFEAERIILRGIVETILKKFCLESYNSDFLFVDPVNDDAYPESKPSIEFFLENLNKWCGSDQQSVLLILGGEKLWDKRIRTLLPASHFRTFLKVLETENSLLWKIIDTKYSNEGVQEHFRLNKSSCTKEEIELCFLAIRKAAELCVKQSLFTQQEMSTYLQSDLERFVDQILANPALAKHTIWIQRRIWELAHWNGQSLTDFTYLFNHLNQKSELFDEAITLTTNDEPVNPKLTCPNLQLVGQLRKVRQTIEHSLPKSRTKTMYLPLQVLNFLTDFTGKSSDIYSKLDAEKALLTKVRLQMSKHELSKSSQTISTMNWTDYLVLFASQTVQMLKHLIADSFMDDLPPRLVLQSNLVDEKETHRKFLMNSYEGLNVQSEPFKMISSVDGQMKLEWDDDEEHSEFRERETSVLAAYLTGSSKLPGLLYAPPGSGKSSLLRWAIRKFESIHSPQTPPQPNQELANKVITHHPLVIICCSARTCASFKLQSILIRFIEELAMKFDCLTQTTRSLCEYAEAVRCFWDFLRKANAQNPILIVLDNVELIYPSEHVRMFRWLPHELPNRHVRILMTTNSTRIVEGFTKRFGSDCSLTLASGFQVNALLSRIYPKLVMEKMRQVKPNLSSPPDLNSLKKQIDDVVNSAVQKNTCPAYVNLLADILATWQLGRGGSLAPTMPSDLPSLFAIRLQQIQFDLQQESLLSLALFRTTAYLACARIGLTLAEIVELLQSDSDVVAERRRRTQNESRARFPMGSLLNLLYSPNYGLTSYLTLIWTDNRCVISFASESFKQGASLFWGFQAEETEARSGADDYLDYEEINANTDKEAETLGPAPPKAREFHQFLIDHWLGMSGQSEKTFAMDNLNANQLNPSSSLYATDYLHSYYWLADLPVRSNEQSANPVSNPVMGTTDKIWICNARRLTELPYQLMRTGSEHVQDLVKHVIFSHDYIFGELLLSSRPNDIISEFYYLRQVNQIRSMDTMTNLIALLRSLSKKLSECPMLLSEQLAGRIGHLIGTTHADFGESLLFSIDCNSPKVNCLIPLLPFCYSPPLQPELTHVEFASPNVGSLATLSPDLRFLFTLTPTEWSDDKKPKKQVGDTFIILWEVNSLTKANTFSIGKWPEHQFLEAYFPPQQNQYVLLHYTMKKSASKRNSGYLLLNMELCSVDHNLSMAWPWEPEIVNLTRTYLMITDRQANQSAVNEDSHNLDMATTHRIPHLTNSTNKTNKIPMPCYITSTERFWIGPSYWPVPLKTSSDKKTKQQQQKRQSFVDELAAANMLQVRPTNAWDSVVAMLKCPLAANVFLSSAHGENLYVGCKSVGYIYRFDLNQIHRKEVKTLKPTLELNLEKGLQDLIHREQLKPSQNTDQCLLCWDQDSLRMIEQARHQVRVQKIFISPDERYLAALYNANDYRLILGFWQLSSKTLIAGLMAYPESQIRFGYGGNESRILHFVRGSKSQTSIEVIEIGGPSAGGTNAASNSFMISASQRLMAKSNAGNVIKILRLKCISQVVDECHFARGGNIIMVGGGEIFLTTVNVLSQHSKGQGPLALQGIGTQLGRVTYHPELNIIYSDHTSDQELFSYYNLISQNLIGIRKSGGGPKQIDQNEHYLLGEPIIEDYPKERYVSTDGKWLALLYNVRKTYPSDKESRSNLETPTDEDYRKPKLPFLNYFTSKWEQYLTDETAMMGGIGLSHNQSIIRLYSLSEDSGRSGLRCQISLIGETIFQLTAKHGLFTLKPDHASISKIEKLVNSKVVPKTESVSSTIAKPQAILSRYSSKSGEFLGYIYLEHPVISGSQIVGNDKYLVVCCGFQGQWLRILEAPQFTNAVRDLDLHKLFRQHDDYARTANIIRIFICQAIPTTVVVHYMWPKPDTALYAATIDLTSRTDSECLIIQMMCLDPLVDVSPDGLLGLDANLRLVNLRKGQLIGMLKSTTLIPGSNMEPEILCGRITPDKAYILTITCLNEQADPWLIVIQNDPTRGFPIIGRALLSPIERSALESRTHYPQVAVQLGHRGRLIVIRLDDYAEFKVFTISEALEKLHVANYVSAKDRIRNLLPMDKSLAEPNVWATVQRGAKRLDDIFTQFVRSISVAYSSDDSGSEDLI